jgi:hypothetical protein
LKEEFLRFNGQGWEDPFPHLRDESRDCILLTQGFDTEVLGDEIGFVAKSFQHSGSELREVVLPGRVKASQGSEFPLVKQGGFSSEEEHATFGLVAVIVPV